MNIFRIRINDISHLGAYKEIAEQAHLGIKMHPNGGFTLYVSPVWGIAQSCTFHGVWAT